MAYKYQTRNWAIPTSKSTPNKEAKRLNSQYQKNINALNKLRQTDITERQRTLKKFSDTENSSTNQAFNNRTDAFFLQNGQEYSDIAMGMGASGGNVIDPAEGAAAQNALMQELEIWQTFVGLSNGLIPDLEKAFAQGGGDIGALVTDARINDIEMLGMIHNLWNNPEGMELVREDGTLTLKQDLGDGNIKTLNLEEFNSIYESAEEIAMTINDPSDLMKEGVEGTKTLVSGWASQKTEKVYNPETGQYEKQTWDMVDVDKLKNGMLEKGVWDTVMNNSLSAPGYWEYLSKNYEGDKKGWNPEWIGSGPGATSDEQLSLEELKRNFPNRSKEEYLAMQQSNYTVEALKQREQFANAWSDIAINKNVPTEAQLKSTETWYSAGQEASMYNARQQRIIAELDEKHYQEFKGGIVGQLGRDEGMSRELFELPEGGKERADRLMEELKELDNDMGYDDVYEIVEDDGVFSVMKLQYNTDGAKIDSKNMSEKFLSPRSYRKHLNTRLLENASAAEKNKIKDIINQYDTYLQESNKPSSAKPSSSSSKSPFNATNILNPTSSDEKKPKVLKEEEEEEKTTSSDPQQYSKSEISEFNNANSEEEILESTVFENELDKIVRDYHGESGSRQAYRNSKKARDKAFKNAKILLMKEYFED